MLNLLLVFSFCLFILPAQVAEMTGRKGRLVRSSDGGAGVVYEARNASGVEAGEPPGFMGEFRF